MCSLLLIHFEFCSSSGNRTSPLSSRQGSECKYATNKDCLQHVRILLMSVNKNHWMIFLCDLLTVMLTFCGFIQTVDRTLSSSGKSNSGNQLRFLKINFFFWTNYMSMLIWFVSGNLTSYWVLIWASWRTEPWIKHWKHCWSRSNQGCNGKVIFAISR